MREDKCGFIKSKLPPILQRLKMEAENGLYLTQHFESKLKGLAGSVFKLKQALKKLDYKRTACKAGCEVLFP